VKQEVASFQKTTCEEVAPLIIHKEKVSRLYDVFTQKKSPT
jgi:hypothetical protein